MSNQPYLRFNLNAGPSGRRPSAAQLVQLIRTQVSANHLPPGCRVPPVRVLAHQFSISKNTVQRAYNELVAQGLLENKKRIGLFLAPPQKKKTAPTYHSGGAGHRDDTAPLPLSPGQRSSD